MRHQLLALCCFATAIPAFEEYKCSSRLTGSFGSHASDASPKAVAVASSQGAGPLPESCADRRREACSATLMEEFCTSIQSPLPSFASSGELLQFRER